jgi:hypothetical protein
MELPSLCIRAKGKPLAARPLGLEGFFTQAKAFGYQKPEEILILEVAAGFSLRKYFKNQKIKNHTQAKACAYLRTKNQSFKKMVVR